MNTCHYSLQRPELFTNDQMGSNDWMTLGDVSKLRQMYGCNTGCKYITQDRNVCPGSKTAGNQR